jgi:hypothetical protein
MERIMVQGQPRQKVSKTSSQPIAGLVGMCLSSMLLGRLRSGGSWLQANMEISTFMRSDPSRKKMGMMSAPVLSGTWGSPK